MKFSNPIGLAAGFDKDARVIDAMLSLWASASSKRARSRRSRKPAIRSRGSSVSTKIAPSSTGSASTAAASPPFAQRLIKRLRRPHARGIVGANVGKNRDTADGAADYVACIEQLSGLSDYLVVNLSSPNTPGLRGLQARAPIEDLLRRVLLARKRAAPNPEKPPPLLAKVGPDLSNDQLRDIAEAALGTGVDGLIVGNTTIDRPSSLKSNDKAEAGGLSGAPLLSAVHRLPCRNVPADQGPPAADRLRRRRQRRRRLCQDPRRRLAGAGLFRAGLRRAGPGSSASSASWRQLLRADGFARVADAVGRGH